MLLIWITAIIVFIGVELATTALVSVWFAFGAVAAAICAGVGAAKWVQTIAFVVISVVSLAAFRGIWVSRLRNRPIEPTNTDLLIGRTGIITEPVSALAGTGRVKVSGQEWRAVPLNNSEIPEGCSVIVCGVQGVKLICKEK